MTMVTRLFHMAGALGWLLGAILYWQDPTLYASGIAKFALVSGLVFCGIESIKDAVS